MFKAGKVLARWVAKPFVSLVASQASLEVCHRLKFYPEQRLANFMMGSGENWAYWVLLTILTGSVWFILDWIFYRRGQFSHATHRSRVFVDAAVLYAARYSNRGEVGLALKDAVRDRFRKAAFTGKIHVCGLLVIDSKTTSGVAAEIPAKYWETHELDDNVFRLVLPNKWETVGVVYPETRHLTGNEDADLYANLTVPAAEVLALWPETKMGGPLGKIIVGGTDLSICRQYRQTHIP